MSFKRNVAVSYASQIYVTLVGIIVLPMYLKYMGAEAYGLVGFFTMLQSLFNLLDMGLTPTVARETARFRGGASKAITYRSLFRSLQIIFSIVAFVGCLILLSVTDWVSKNWLNVHELNLSQVRFALQLMSLAVAFRWMSGLYRGCISGSERFQWLGLFNALVATVRFIGVLPLLMLHEASIIFFFLYQVVVSILELIFLVVKARSLLPSMLFGEVISWAPKLLFLPIASILKFSLAIALTSSIWVLVTQTDKLIVSKILPLSDYGYFTLAVLVASGVMVASGPISSALMPRMAKMQAEDNNEALINLYKTATQAVAVIAISAGAMVSIFAEQILLIWTKDPIVAKEAGPILKYYSMGNMLLALSAFAYYLQYAYGNLRLHLIGSAMFAAVLVPLLIWFTHNYGSLGAGYSWLAVNLLYFFLWVPLIHKKFVRGLHMQWILNDVLPIALGAIVSCVIFKSIFLFLEMRFLTLTTLLIFSVACLISAACCSSYIRNKVRTFDFGYRR